MFVDSLVVSYFQPMGELNSMLLLAQIAQNAPAALGTNFSTLDWVIVAVYLVLPLGIGVFAYKYIHSVKGFVIGGGADDAT